VMMPQNWVPWSLNQTIWRTWLLMNLAHLVVVACYCMKSCFVPPHVVDQSIFSLEISIREANDYCSELEWNVIMYDKRSHLMIHCFERKRKAHNY
jgi:hypothetical protein